MRCHPVSVPNHRFLSMTCHLISVSNHRFLCVNCHLISVSNHRLLHRHEPSPDFRWRWQSWRIRCRIVRQTLAGSPLSGFRTEKPHLRPKVCKNANVDIVRVTRGPFVTSPLAPRGEIRPLGGMFTPSFTPRGEHSLLCVEEWRGEQRISPPGDNFTPWGQNSPLGDKFAPGVKVCS
jgi:hypothetical protein